MKNLQIWSDLSVTDDIAKTQQNFGRKITAIDATWQVWKMTERFGKIGEGWGWEAGEPKTVTLPTGDVMILVSVSVWTEKREHIFGGFTGGAMLVSNNRVDDDAGKKATTDALTKAFSHLGLSADVFMSKFKDNKYTNKPESSGATLPPSGQGDSSGVSSLPSESSASITPTIKSVAPKSKQEEALDRMMAQINGAKNYQESCDILRRWVFAAQTLSGVELMFNRLKPTTDEYIKIFSDKKLEMMRAKKEEISNG